MTCKKVFGSLFIILFCLFCSCGKIKTNVWLPSGNGEFIDLTMCMKSDGFYWEDILDSVKILSLETNEESLIGEIVQVEFFEDRIFIYDMVLGGSVIIFDTDGKFIKRLPCGNGPDEISRVVGISFDKWNEELLVIQNPSIQRFSIDGNYIGNYDIPFPIDKLKVTKDEFVFSKMKGHKCNTIYDFDKYSIIITDRNINILRMMLPYTSERSTTFMSECEDSLTIAMLGNDTIYNYNSDTLQVSYILNIPNKADVSSMNFDDMLKFLQTTKPFTECFLGNYLENSSHQFFEFEYGIYPYTLFRDKKNGNIGGGLGIMIDEGNKNLFAIKQPITLYNNWFVTIEQPYNYQKGQITSNQFISHTDLSILESLNNESNPFIVMYQLKPFE